MKILPILAFMLLAVSGRAASDQEAIKTQRLAQNQAILALRKVQSANEAGPNDRKAQLEKAIDAVTAFWTDDVTIRRGLGEPLSGKKGYRTLYESFSPTQTIAQREPTEIVVSSHWPLAYESGTWRSYIGGITGPVAISGRYAAQWVKRDGRWLIRAEVFVALDGAGVGLESKAVP